MDYSKYLPYFDDSIDEIIEKFQSELLMRATPKRVSEIKSELRIYLEHFKKLKDANPDIVIEDQVSAILLSFLINPELSIYDRDAHFNGTWVAFWGNSRKESLEQVIDTCKKRNPSDTKWTRVCVQAAKDYYSLFAPSPILFDKFKRKFRRL